MLFYKYVEVEILPETFVASPYNGYNKILGYGGVRFKRINGKWIRKNGHYLVFGQVGDVIRVGEYKRENYVMHLPEHPYKLKAGDSVIMPIPKWNVLPIFPHISNVTHNTEIKIKLNFKRKVQWQEQYI